MVRRCGSGKVLVTVLFVTGLLLCSDTWAREGPYYQTSVMTRVTRKLVRGCANTAFGWCEIPRNIHIGIEDLDPLTGTVVGLVRGTGQGIERVHRWSVRRCIGELHVQNILEMPFLFQQCCHHIHPLDHLSLAIALQAEKSLCTPIEDQLEENIFRLRVVIRSISKRAPGQAYIETGTLSTDFIDAR